MAHLSLTPEDYKANICKRMRDRNYRLVWGNLDDLSPMLIAMWKHANDSEHKLVKGFNWNAHITRNR